MCPLFNILKPFLALIILIPALLGTGCAGLSGNSASFESLSDTETNLYETGPIDIPVTIAKLQSVDAEKISLSYSSGNPTESLNLASPTAFAENLLSTYTVVGTADAVNTDNNTPYVMLVNGTETAIEPVLDDGSFTATINAEESDTIAVLPVDEVQTTGAPPVFMNYTAGVTAISLTNSDSVYRFMNLVIQDHYMYFSTQTTGTTTTFNLYRRHLDGSSVETIAEGLDSPVRFLTVNSQAKITYLNHNSEVYFIDNTQTVTNPLWGTPELIYSFNTNLPDPDDFNVQIQIKPYTATNGDIIITNKIAVNNVEQSSMLKAYDKDSGTLSEFISGLDYENATFDMGAEDTLYAIITNDEPFPENSEGKFVYAYLYKFNMTDGTAIWDNRTLLYTLTANSNTSSSQVYHLDVNPQNKITWGISNGAEFHWRYFEEGLLSPVPILDYTLTENNSLSGWFYISPGSTQSEINLVTCISTSADDQANKMIFRNLAATDAGDFFQLTDSSLTSTCKASINMDDAGRVLYYYQGFVENTTSLTDPQLSFIDLNQIDLSDIVEF